MGKIRGKEQWESEVTKTYESDSGIRLKGKRNTLDWLKWKPGAMGNPERPPLQPALSMLGNCGGIKWQALTERGPDVVSHILCGLSVTCK